MVASEKLIGRHIVLIQNLFVSLSANLNNRELSNQTWRTGTSKDGSNMEEKSEEKT